MTFHIFYENVQKFLIELEWNIVWQHSVCVCLKPAPVINLISLIIFVFILTQELDF